MFSFIQKQWFLIAIAAASVLGYIHPEWGAPIRDYDIVGFGVVLAFFATGLCLETQTIFRQITSVRAPVMAVLSSLVLYPLLAWFMSLPILPYEFVVGVCVIGTAPVTVSSGTILTAIARGNVPLSILICISTSFLAIFTIPVILNLLLSAEADIELPVLGMAMGLVYKVLVPIAMGQVFRPFFIAVIQRYEHQISIFQSCIIVLIIYNVVSSSAETIARAGSSICGVTLFIIGLHFFMLLMNYMIARLIKLDSPSTIAFTIHTSQKTLTVSYVIWAGFFSTEYPMAFIPAIICQLTQMTAGTFVAEYFKKYGHSEK